MKFGVSAFAWTGELTLSHLALVTKARDYGFKSIEVPMFAPAALPVAEFRRVIAEADLECTVCAILPPGINPISPEADVRRRARLHLAACIEATAALGAKLLGGPLYAPIGYLPNHRPTADEWTWAVEAFQSVGELLDKHGVTLSLEPVNRSETFFLRTAREAKALCEAIGHPRVGVTIDTFHANIEEKDIVAAIRELGPHLQHLHASENDRGLLGTGHVDFAGILRALEAANYAGHVTIEGFGYSLSEPNAPGALWADTSVAPEDIATRGLAYLSGLSSR